jgi:DNA-binding transcriptional MerR regulator
MQEKLLTAGEFATLARTTKRTVLWYAEKGILEPHKTDGSGYRFYRPDQIIDFQGVLLMRKLGFSVAEIKKHLTDGQSLRQMFEQKQGLIEQQIGHLQRMLTDAKHYYQNLDATSTLVRPELVQIESFDMYYIEREGPYARIKDYNVEFRDMFAVLPDDAVHLTAFAKGQFEPAKAQMKIGVVCRPGLLLKTGASVGRETVPAYTALKYVHTGSTTLLSLLWQELGGYRRRQHLPRNTGLPFADIELYTLDISPYPDPDDSLVTELHMPVRT